jgi:hypothetical protein
LMRPIGVLTVAFALFMERKVFAAFCKKQAFSCLERD